MKSQPNKRLSEVTKQQSVDRASKLASSFLSDDDLDTVLPVVSPPAAPTQPLVEVIQKGEADFAEGRGTILTMDELQTAVNPDTAFSAAPDHGQPVAEMVAAPQQVRSQKAPVGRKERVRRSTTVVDLPEVVNQPVPEGLRCTKMIMLTDEHHDMLRELHFKFKKPMSVILYNLLEPAHEALQREHLKGN